MPATVVYVLSPSGSRATPSLKVQLNGGGFIEEGAGGGEGLLIPGLLTIVLLFEVFCPRRALYLAECSDLGLYRLLDEPTKRAACLCCGVHVSASYVHVES